MPSDKITIKCPLCNWKPANKSQWQCTCGQIWNTFDTVGECPECKNKWKETQCPSCHEWSEHDDWYIIPVDFESLLHTTNESPTINDKDNLNAYYVPEVDLEIQITRIARGWFLKKAQLFSNHPALKQRWEEIFVKEPEQLIPLELGMKQISFLKGFSADSPLENIGVSGFNCLMSVLAIRHMNCVVKYGFPKNGIIIDRYTFNNLNGLRIQLFNKVNHRYESGMTNEIGHHCFEADSNRHLISKARLNELNNIKVGLYSDVYMEDTPFIQYIKKTILRDLKKMKIANCQMKEMPETDFHYGGRSWKFMEQNLSGVLPVNRKYFCVCLFMLEVVRTALLKTHMDAFIQIQGMKLFPQFGFYLSGVFESETAHYLLEQPTKHGVDFDMISDFELQDFAAYVFDRVDDYLSDNADIESMYKSIVTDSEFHADCPIFNRLKKAMCSQLIELSKGK